MDGWRDTDVAESGVTASGSESSTADVGRSDVLEVEVTLHARARGRTKAARAASKTRRRAVMPIVSAETLNYVSALPLMSHPEQVGRERCEPGGPGFRPKCGERGSLGCTHMCDKKCGERGFKFLGTCGHRVDKRRCGKCVDKG